MNEETFPQKKRTLYPLILLAVVTLLAIGVIAFVLALSSGSDGVPAQDFTLPFIGQDGSFTLSEQRGNVVLINLFGSWCAPCRDEAPVLQATWES